MFEVEVLAPTKRPFYIKWNHVKPLFNINLMIQQIKLMPNWKKSLIKSHMGKKFGEFNNKLETTLKEMKLIETVNEKIKTENTVSKWNTKHKIKIEIFKQANLGISIEISGIPNTVNKNCTNIIKEIDQKFLLTTFFNINDIFINVLEATRITQSENKPTIIIAKLETTDMKKNIIKTAKIKKLNAKMSIVWISNADILIRKDQNSKITRIKFNDDI